ncbi:hypothetical protein KC19_8G021000 [Ceratodon purpureus]|uniref:Uncharacterized protein n=1 Tax=Ceratodon purpureus TaxID=3225 RepID=A0A8T0GXN2_CERPU|nr:hypothetical protein KC19_8G021000 [Ceratodon purpureus]
MLWGLLFVLVILFELVSYKIEQANVRSSELYCAQFLPFVILMACPWIIDCVQLFRESEGNDLYLFLHLPVIKFQFIKDKRMLACFLSSRCASFCILLCSQFKRPNIGT